MNFQRKKILIDKKFQLKYALIIICSVSFMFLVMSWDIYFTMQTIFGKIAEYDEIRSDLINTFSGLSAKALAFSIILGIISIYFTHRIAGPVYRLQKDITDMVNQGDLTKTFHLREKDELKELADALNKMVSTLRSRLVSDDSFRENVQNQLEELKGMLTEKNNLTDEERQLAINQIDELIKQSQSSPLKFKI